MVRGPFETQVARHETEPLDITVEWKTTRGISLLEAGQRSTSRTQGSSH